MKSDWRKTSLTWGKRITLVVLIMFGLAYGVLSLAERSKDALRQGFEAQLSNATGHRATITDMISADLVPVASFRMKGIDIRDRKNSDKRFFHIGQAYIATPFLAIMTSRTKYYGFEVKDVDIASGYIFPKKTSLIFAGISDVTPESSPASLLIDGTYNELPLLFTAELQRKIKKRGPLYTMADNFPITFKLGKNEGKALYVRSFFSAGVENGIMTRDGRELEFRFEVLDEKSLKIKGEGTLDGGFFNAELTKSDEDNILKISAETQKDSDLAHLKEFVTGIRNDLGLSEDDLTIIYDVAPPATSQAKEKKAQ